MPKKYIDTAKRKQNEAAMLAQAPTQPIVEYLNEGECTPVIQFHFRGRSVKTCVAALMDEFSWSATEALTFYEQNKDKKECQ